MQSAAAQAQSSCVPNSFTYVIGTVFVSADSIPLTCKVSGCVLSQFYFGVRANVYMAQAEDDVHFSQNVA